MCRSHEQGGRRCHNTVARAAATIRQRLSRYARWMDAAEDAGDTDRLDRMSALFMRANDDLRAHQSATDGTAPPVIPEPTPTRAAEFTIEATKRWSDQALIDAWHDTVDDPAAREALERVFAHRDDEAESQRAAEHARRVLMKPVEECTDAELASRFGASSTFEDRSPLTNPARRPARNLTPDEVVDEEYDLYVQQMYLKALEECKTTLTNGRGRAKGISDDALFRGSSRMARSYGSEELQAFFGRYGRLSKAAFRYERLGRPGDRQAWLNSTLGDWGHVAA